MFDLSGKDYNDFGRYQACLGTERFHYILATVPHAWPIPVSLGLCVPLECKVADFEEFKPVIVQGLNAAIPVLFKGIKGVDPNKQLGTSDLQFKDSQAENNRVSTVDFGAVFVMILIILFTGFGICGSVLWFLKRRKDLKAEQEQ